MKMEASDPDLATIVSRIESGDLDLQPDFQRGEVWPTAKKQRLIDSILREWHVPPIHVIEVLETAQEEVLDGQQRLVAIRDFVAGRIGVDGSIPPMDEAIAGLDGCSYESLPLAVRRRFNKFPIRVFRITDYEPEEPGELFYRLNQPTHLTAAEQRNAFYGPVRKQIKSLVRRLTRAGISKGTIGFSNSRMSYDEVVARVCIAIERGALTERVTAKNLADVYRTDQALSKSTISSCSRGVDLFAGIINECEYLIRLNKATFFSWLYFATAVRKMRRVLQPIDKMAEFFRFFESVREGGHRGEGAPGLKPFGLLELSPIYVRRLVSVYMDRSSSRVTDAASVAARDVFIWTVFSHFLGKSASRSVWQFSTIYKWLKRNTEDANAGIYMSDMIYRSGWGRPQ